MLKIIEGDPSTINKTSWSCHKDSSRVSDIHFPVRISSHETLDPLLWGFIFKDV
jgi:hypothetical protein